MSSCAQLTLAEMVDLLDSGLPYRSRSSAFVQKASSQMSRGDEHPPQLLRTEEDGHHMSDEKPEKALTGAECASL